MERRESPGPSECETKQTASDERAPQQIIQSQLEEFTYSSDDEVDDVDQGTCFMCNRECEVAKFTSGKVWCYTCIMIFTSCHGCCDRFLSAGTWPDREWSDKDKSAHQAYEALYLKHQSAELYKWMYKSWYTYDRYDEAQEANLTAFLAAFREMMARINP